MMAVSVILATAPAVAAPNRGTGSTPTGTGGTSLVSSMPVSSTGGTSLQTGGASGIQKQVQIASEISELRQRVPKGYSIVNESIVGGYYIAYYDSDEVETVPCEEDVPEWKFTVCYHFVDDCHVMVHKLGSNETTIYDPRVWELSKENGKG